MEAEKPSTLDPRLEQSLQINLREHSLTEEANTSRNVQLQEGMNHPMIHLPVQDDSVDLITQVMRQIRFRDDEEASEPEIRHFSHDHPLWLSTPQTSYANDCESLEELKNNIGSKCEACMRQISSAPYYSCQECNFLIHEGCAGLPSEIQHPFHPDHPLVLIPKATAEFADLFDCNACQLTSNGFAYNCASCEFYLDVFCSLLSNALSHEAHPHPLILRPESKNDRCDACHKSCNGFLFECTKCGFNLDILCAAYPSTVRHRHGQHTLKLSYIVTERHSDEICCEVCGEKLNIEGSWFYNCADCSNAFHPECIFNLDDYRLIKFGSSIALKGHPHSMTMVLEKGKKPSCCNCAQPYEGISFQCTAAKCQYQVSGLDLSFNLDGFCAQIFNIIDYDSQNE